jgi:hypothetical protein
MERASAGYQRELIDALAGAYGAGLNPDNFS